MLNKFNAPRCVAQVMLLSVVALMGHAAAMEKRSMQDAVRALFGDNAVFDEGELSVPVGTTKPTAPLPVAIVPAQKVPAGRPARGKLGVTDLTDGEWGSVCSFFFDRALEEVYHAKAIRKFVNFMLLVVEKGVSLEESCQQVGFTRHQVKSFLNYAAEPMLDALLWLFSKGGRGVSFPEQPTGILADFTHEYGDHDFFKKLFPAFKPDLSSEEDSACDDNSRQGESEDDLDDVQNAASCVAVQEPMVRRKTRDVCAQTDISCFGPGTIVLQGIDVVWPQPAEASNAGEAGEAEAIRKAYDIINQRSCCIVDPSLDLTDAEWALIAAECQETFPGYPRSSPIRQVLNTMLVRIRIKIALQRPIKRGVVSPEVLRCMINPNTLTNYWRIKKGHRQALRSIFDKLKANEFKDGHRLRTWPAESPMLRCLYGDDGFEHLIAREEE